MLSLNTSSCNHLCVIWFTSYYFTVKSISGMFSNPAKRRKYNTTGNDFDSLVLWRKTCTTEVLWNEMIEVLQTLFFCEKDVLLMTLNFHRDKSFQRTQRYQNVRQSYNLGQFKWINNTNPSPPPLISMMGKRAHFGFCGNSSLIRGEGGPISLSVLIWPIEYRFLPLYEVSSKAEHYRWPVICWP